MTVARVVVVVVAVLEVVVASVVVTLAVVVVTPNVEVVVTSPRCVVVVVSGSTLVVHAAATRHKPRIVIRPAKSTSSIGHLTWSRRRYFVTRAQRPSATRRLGDSATRRLGLTLARHTQKEAMAQYSSAPELQIDLAKSYTATIRTNHGDITLDLHAAEAPLTVNNFVFLAREGFYDGVIFHRVINNFMIQGGDPTGTGTGGPGYRFRDELEGSGAYARGTLAMANAGPNTNGSQFFICHTDLPRLPHAYSIFGQVTSGFETVDAIADLATDGRDKPVEEARIASVAISES